MKSLFEIKNEKLKLLFTVLFFGAIWGIVEATLGTILHLPMFETAKIFLCSSTVIVPIGLALLACAYKATGKLRACIYVGLIAGAIKLTTGFFLGWIDRVYNPAIYIVMESACMMGALAIFKPKDVLSLKTLAAFLVANTIYQLSYLGHAAITGSTNNAFASFEAFNTIGVKYLFTLNMIAILYSFAFGSILFGLKKLFEKKDIKLSENITKIAFSPLCATFCAVLAVTLTALI